MASGGSNRTVTSGPWVDAEDEVHLRAVLGDAGQRVGAGLEVAAAAQRLGERVEPPAQRRRLVRRARLQRNPVAQIGGGAFRHALIGERVDLRPGAGGHVEDEVACTLAGGRQRLRRDRGAQVPGAAQRVLERARDIGGAAQGRRRAEPFDDGRPERRLGHPERAAEARSAARPAAAPRRPRPPRPPPPATPRRARRGTGPCS